MMLTKQMLRLAEDARLFGDCVLCLWSRFGMFGRRNFGNHNLSGRRVPLSWYKTLLWNIYFFLPSQSFKISTTFMLQIPKGVLKNYGVGGVGKFSAGPVKKFLTPPSRGKKNSDPPRGVKKFLTPPSIISRHPSNKFVYDWYFE